jgi:cytochrome c peroxidase
MLYHEVRLSADDTVSCNSCHDLENFGVDGKSLSEGVGGQLGGRNSPTVFHAAGHFTQFWDGRAADVEEQALGPILNPVEMAMPDGDAVVAKLKDIPEYPPLFAAAFPDEGEPLTFENVGLAIGAFERGLVLPGRLDDLLAGQADALTPLELHGLATFQSVGCVTCHSGPAVGGMTFQKLGLVQAWPDLTDAGRMEATGDEADRGLFKVPSLRLIRHTGPYLHDGSVTDLHEMVRLMGRHQTGIELDEQQVDAIVAFLGTLG